MQRILSFGLCGLFLFSAASSACAQPPATLLASCAWVRAENDGAGAGFVVDADQKLMVTCRHIVAERTRVDVIFPWVHQGKLVADRREYLANRTLLRELGLLVTGRIILTSDQLDLALIRLETLPEKVKAAEFAASPPQAGDRIRVIGNRLDLDTVWNLTSGLVRTTGHLSDGYFWRAKKLCVNAATIVGQLPIEEGDSGGPVFNDAGELVGMVSALRRQCPLAAVAISGEEVRKFAGLPEPAPKKGKATPSSEVVEALMGATVWVRPTSTSMHLAGVLIDKNLVLTCAKGLACGDAVGIAFPVCDNNRWNGERAEYKDLVGLALRGCWRSATVLALDLDRELALLKLDSTPPFAHTVPLATQLPNLGDRLHSMNHPSGLEFAWVYSSGTVRQRGDIAVAAGENARRITTLVCQLPAQAGSPGGPVLNDQGELVGILATKESTQMVGYAISSGEIDAFLDTARFDRPPRTVAGLRVRAEELSQRFAREAALNLARYAEANRVAGNLVAAKTDCDKALSLDPGCPVARLCRARMLDTTTALAELDVAVEKGPFNRAVFFHRSELAAIAKDWRKSRGDLERIVDVDPLDAQSRQRLVGVLLELNEDAKALAAVGDTLRADARRMPSLAGDLLVQAESLAKKFPDAPAIPATWLVRALTAAENAIRDQAMKGEVSELLKRASAAKNDSGRLTLLREGLKKWK
jgi:S1-C subfamily serine protease